MTLVAPHPSPNPGPSRPLQALTQGAVCHIGPAWHSIATCPTERGNGIVQSFTSPALRLTESIKQARPPCISPSPSVAASLPHLLPFLPPPSLLFLTPLSQLSLCPPLSLYLSLSLSIYLSRCKHEMGNTGICECHKFLK